jgi:hypothetical protein
MGVRGTRARAPSLRGWDRASQRTAVALSPPHLRAPNLRASSESAYAHCGGGTRQAKAEGAAAAASRAARSARPVRGAQATRPAPAPSASCCHSLPSPAAALTSGGDVLHSCAAAQRACAGQRGPAGRVCASCTPRQDSRVATAAQSGARCAAPRACAGAPLAVSTHRAAGASAWAWRDAARTPVFSIPNACSVVAAITSRAPGRLCSSYNDTGHQVQQLLPAV